MNLLTNNKNFPSNKLRRIFVFMRMKSYSLKPLQTNKTGRVRHRVMSSADHNPVKLFVFRLASFFLNCNNPPSRLLIIRSPFNVSDRCFKLDVFQKIKMFDVHKEIFENQLMRHERWEVLWDREIAECHHLFTGVDDKVFVNACSAFFNIVWVIPQSTDSIAHFKTNRWKLFF